MTMIRRIKENLFPVAVALAYIIIFIANPIMGMESVKSSGYYIKEMLMLHFQCASCFIRRGPPFGTLLLY